MQTQRILSRLPEGATARMAIQALKHDPDRAHRHLAYERKPIEVEAREHEAMHDVLPLTIPVGAIPNPG